MTNFGKQSFECSCFFDIFVGFGQLIYMYFTCDIIFGEILYVRENYRDCIQFPIKMFIFFVFLFVCAVILSHFCHVLSLSTNC